jgi:DNA-binding response OmpR family regulator
VGGHREPVVVLVSAHHSQMDRVRGTLAGAEATLGKPLDETALTRLLHLHGVALAQPPRHAPSPRKAREAEPR